MKLTDMIKKEKMNKKRTATPAQIKDWTSVLNGKECVTETRILLKSPDMYGLTLSNNMKRVIRIYRQSFVRAFHYKLYFTYIYQNYINYVISLPTFS